MNLIEKKLLIPGNGVMYYSEGKSNMEDYAGLLNIIIIKINDMNICHGD